MTASDWPWRRVFNRTTSPDLDEVPTQQFIDENFTDYFGKTWLPRNSSLKSLDAILQSFWDGSQASTPTNSFQIFCIADGGRWPVNETNEAYMNQHIRFVAFVAGKTNGNGEPTTDEAPFDDTNPGESFTLCIVGSADLKSETRFLQVASWDGKIFRFYGRDPLQDEAHVGMDNAPSAWIYQGASSDTLTPEGTYLGPGNGHVNGSLIMKELHKPWLHWYVGDPTFTNNLPAKYRTDFLAAEYLGPNTVLSNVSAADDMERLVMTAIGSYMRSRATSEFFDEPGKPLPKIEKGLKRWAAHILLTTTINLATSQTAQTHGSGESHLAPLDHFFNFELQTATQTTIWPNSATDFSFPIELYTAALQKDIQLVMIQNVDPEHVPKSHTPIVLNKDTSLASGDPKSGPANVTAIVIEQGEGADGQFTILQSSFEDAIAAKVLLSQKTKSKVASLLSSNTFNAMAMVDAWNPVYSWRRGVLLQYVPDDATRDEATGIYDWEERFICGVRASPRCKDAQSPESEFLKNLSPAVQQDFTDNKMPAYLKAVRKALKTQEGIARFLKLAESRRRIYRPLPLDEFALTLPWAMNYPAGVYYEMLPDATIQPISPRGMDFFKSWRSSLWSYNPQLIPAPDAHGISNTDASSSTAALLTADSLGISCQSSRVSSRPKRGGCPMIGLHKRQTLTEELKVLPASLQHPTWDDNILSIMTAPAWLPADTRETIAGHWKKAMMHYGAQMPDGENLMLDNYEHVKLQAVTIYQHCASRSMPITRDPTHYWPQDILDTFHCWVQQGCRKSASDPIVPRTELLAKLITPVFRVRKDIRDLTSEELQTYRVKLRDILQVGSLGSKWQDLGELHAWWCLHYQEATFPWHRCWLKYVEILIDFPIPFWNCFATDAADPASDAAGIPQAFLDETFVAPDGNTQPNPLKYALAYKGQSKDKTSKFVQRNPILIGGRPPQPGPALDKWNREIRMFEKYHKQVLHALSVEKFSTPQDIGIPFAAFPAFTEDMPDKTYAVQESFDGWFEQVHDNFHGWLGGPSGDMSDNTYTAFDPIFLSYHCNMDRLFEHYMQTHPKAQVTPNFPLKPFLKDATNLCYTNPNAWAYATIGEGAKNCQAMGYVYAPPVCPDPWQTTQSVGKMPVSTGGTAMHIHDVNSIKDQIEAKQAVLKRVPHIVFKGIVCTDESYQIDVFLRGAKSAEPDPHTNVDYIGGLYRMGMGVPHDVQEAPNRSRCRASAVVRAISAEHVADRIDSGFFQVVTKSGKEVPKEEWMQLKGFTGELAWILR